MLVFYHYVFMCNQNKNTLSFDYKFKNFNLLEIHLKYENHYLKKGPLPETCSKLN